MKEIKHHYGWVELGNETPYEHTRRTHEFLTDDNHVWEDNGEIIIIRRNENSPAYHPLTPSWAKLTDLWFSMPYREKQKTKEESYESTRKS